MTLFFEPPTMIKFKHSHPLPSLPLGPPLGETVCMMRNIDSQFKSWLYHLSCSFSVVSLSSLVKYLLHIIPLEAVAVSLQDSLDDPCLLNSMPWYNAFLHCGRVGLCGVKIWHKGRHFTCEIRIWKTVTFTFRGLPSDHSLQGKPITRSSNPMERPAWWGTKACQETTGMILGVGPPTPGTFWIYYNPGCQLLCNLLKDPKSKWSSKLLPNSWTLPTLNIINW